MSFPICADDDDDCRRTIAGTVSGFSGDGSVAKNAELRSPFAVAVAANTFYIADSLNGAIRRVDPVGGITTVVGVIDPDRMGPLSQAQLADPRAFVLGPLSLFAGGSSGTLQATRPGTGQLEVVAGRYPQPSVIGARARYRGQSFGDVKGVAFDATTGIIYLTEATANRIDVVTVVDANAPATWTIAPLANVAGTAGFADGAVATARFRGPSGLYFDAAARVLYVADSGNHLIRALDLASGTATTIAGVPQTRGYFGDGGAATSAVGSPTLFNSESMSWKTEFANSKRTSVNSSRHSRRTQLYPA